MASKGSVASANHVALLLLCLSLVIPLFTLVSSTYVIPTVPVPIVPYPHQEGTCPIDALKLGVCANVLNLVKVKLGSPPTLPCCNIIKGIADLEAAACLCTALKANVHGINLDIPVSLSIILNNCGRNNDAGFECT